MLIYNDPVKLILSTEGVCPTSGLTLFGIQVPVHRVNLQVLDNGCIMGYCPVHNTRWFIADRAAVFNLKQNATVVERIFKKRESHGKAQKERPEASP